MTAPNSCIDYQKSALINISLFFILLFMGCGQKPETGSQSSTSAIRDTAAIIKKGQTISKEAFLTLSSNLQQAMAEGGIENALKFCNIQAIPLTESVSSEYQVKLRRASHRPRNPANRADSLEMTIIKNYLKQIEESGELKPVVHERKHGVSFHAPIKIPNQFCLNCHGTPGKNIAEADLKVLKKLYPNDEATGFEVGELRGIWSIYFSEKETK